MFFLFILFITPVFSSFVLQQKMEEHLHEIRANIRMINYRFDFFLQMELLKKINSMEIQGYGKVPNTETLRMICNDISLVQEDCILPLDRAIVFCSINPNCTSFSMNNDVNFYTKDTLNGKFPVRVNVGHVLIGNHEWTTFYKNIQNQLDVQADMDSDDHR
jgi:hypothetical protein